MTTSSSPRQLRVAVIGCGFMGTALVAGIIKGIAGNSQREVQFYLSAPSQRSRQRLDEVFGSDDGHVKLITGNNVEAARAAEVIFLAFEPRKLDEVFGELSLADAARGKLVISVLASVSISQITKVIYVDEEKDGASNHRVARVLPTIGAQINESMTLIAETPFATEDRDLVTWLFEQVGRIQPVSEQLIGTVTAVSAACHALVVVATDAIVDASVAEGVPRSMALSVATQCLRSASSLLHTGTTIEALKDSMSIARGITINALLQLDKNGVRAGISDSVRYAVQYTEEMSKDKK